MSTPTYQDTFITTLRRVKSKERIVSKTCLLSEVSSLGRLFFLIFSSYDFLLVPMANSGQAFNLLCREFHDGKPKPEVLRDLGKALLYSASERADLLIFANKLSKHMRSIATAASPTPVWYILTQFLECYEQLLHYVSVALADEFVYPHNIPMVSHYRSRLPHRPRPDMLAEELMQDFAHLGPTAPEHLLRAAVAYKGVYDQYLIQANAERKRIKSIVVARRTA